MGNRIIIDITDGVSFTPSFYGHWCGLRAVEVLNDLVRKKEYNGINSLMCNFITEVMEHKCQRYSYYIYSHGEAEGAADWDNYSWCLNPVTETWTSTIPELKGKTLSLCDAEEYIAKRKCEV